MMGQKEHVSVCVTLLIAACAMTARAETVVLISGSRIQAKVLKQDAKSVVVDIGSDVIRIPRSEVVRVIKDGGGSKTRPAGPQPAAIEQRGSKWQLYRTAKLERGTIEAKAERYGQAVVMVTTPNGLGSGFLISPDGYLITNYHVIARETRIKITVFARGDKGYEQKHYKKSKIIALNPFDDLALLKIEGARKPFVYAYLGSIQAVTVGERVFAIGNPLGLTRTVSQGIVSTKNRNYRGRLYIQTTTDVNPGNSGGPLFNLKGEVIGVTSMGYLFLSGLNFAIPADVVKRFVANRDAFAYDEDNPNSGFRYLQPGRRIARKKPPGGRLPAIGPSRTDKAVP